MIEPPVVNKCPKSLRHEIETFPKAPVDLIFRVSEAGDSQVEEIEEAGFQVRRTTRIVPTFAVTGPGEALYPLLESSWLIAVEYDRPVRIV